MKHETLFYMKILLIDNYDSFTYNLVQIIEQHGKNEFIVLPYDKVDNNVIAGYDKILLSPGPGIPDDFPKLEAFVRRFYKEKSFFGICLGYEAIALAFGAKLYKPGDVFHGVSKKTCITQKEDYLFRDINDGFQSGLYHSWAIDKSSFPEELIIIALAEDGIIMAISHRRYDIKGIQFHPESIMTKAGGKILFNWLEFHP